METKEETSHSRSAYYKEYRRKNRDSLRTYSKTRYNLSLQTIEKRAIYLIHLLGGKCVRCGLCLCEDNWVVFEFHSNEKDITRSGLTQSYRVLKKKSKEYMLVCANCHRMIHASE